MLFPRFNSGPLRAAIEDTGGTTTLLDDYALIEGEEPSVDAPDKPKEPKVKSPKVDETEPDEDIDEDEEDTPEDDEEPEDELPPGTPTFEELKKKYPNILKDFPALRGALARDVEYTKLFGDVDEAKNIIANNETFQGIREDIFNGTGKEFFEAIQEADPKVFDRFVMNLLPTLNSISPEVHYKAAQPLMENIVRSAYQSGIKNGNDNLKNAALVISNFLLGDHEIAEGKKTTLPVQPKEDESLKSEREQFQQEQFDAFNDSANTEGRTKCLGMVYKSLDPKNETDPANELTPYMKGVLAEKIFNELNETMTADQQHMAYVNSLWAKAKRNGYKAEDKAKITSAFLARAKSLLPSVRVKLVSEALGLTRSTTRKVQKRVEPSNSGRPAGSRNGLKQVDYKTMTDLDILNS